MASTLIRNATIINEQIIRKANVLIEGEKITHISKDEINLPGTSTRIIDAEGKWLFPGVIDDHVHFRDPGFPQKADFHSESAAAAAGGVTTVMDMPNTLPQTTTRKLLEEKLSMVAGKSVTNYALYFGATNDNIDEIRRLDPSTICGVKVFMGSSTGNMRMDNPESLKRIFAESPVLVAVHAEDDTIIQNNLKKYKDLYGNNIPVALHPEIRSEEACYSSSSKAVDLAHQYGTRLHILHLSTARELNLLNNDKPSIEKQITAEVCIHHLWFDRSDYIKYGTRIKWNPAIKSRGDKKALLAGLLDDRLDVIGTDHAPHTLQEKSKPYLLAPSGGPMVQHSLTAMLEMYHQGKITLEKIVEKMCHAPANIFGIEKRGFLREGYQADLVLIDPDNPWTVTPENIMYKCGWSPFEGTRFTSKITHTFINGHIVYETGKVNTHYRGQQLSFVK